MTESFYVYITTADDAEYMRELAVKYAPKRLERLKAIDFEKETPA